MNTRVLDDVIYRVGEGAEMKTLRNRHKEAHARRHSQTKRQTEEIGVRRERGRVRVEEMRFDAACVGESGSRVQQQRARASEENTQKDKELWCCPPFNESISVLSSKVSPGKMQKRLRRGLPAHSI